MANSLIPFCEVIPTSLTDAFCGYERSGREAKITLAKWVGTEMKGGEPMTSWTYPSSVIGHDWVEGG